MGGRSSLPLLPGDRFHNSHVLRLATPCLDLPLLHTLLKFFGYGFQFAPLVSHLASDGTRLLGELGELRGSDEDETGQGNDRKLRGTESEEGLEA